MIELPGCRAGSSISPSPASGPEFIQRRSFAILISAVAKAASWPENSTAASCAAMPSKRLPACEKRTPVRAFSRAIARLPKRGSALIPVPMAVPPSGSRCRRAALSSRRSIAEPNCADQADNSWPSVSGMASIRCVRPVFTSLANSRERRSILPRRCFRAGRRASCQRKAADTWIAVGITSFEL